MVAYTYSRVAALNFNTTPPTVARSATGSVYAVADTTFTTPLTVTMVVGGSTTTTISSDANGFFPDFTVNDRTSVVWKQASSSFTTVLTTSDPVPGPQGNPGNDGATGPKGDRGDLATWQAATFYPLNQIIANPSGDLVKVTTAHTSGGSYDATKFGWVNNNAANLTGTLPEASVPSRLAEASLNATYAPASGSTAYAAKSVETTKLDKTEASATYARIIGATYSVFGDSLANNGEGVAYWLAALSRQTFCFPDSSYIASHPGYTTASLVPLVTEITGLTPKPSYCFVSGGSNDAGSGVAPATFITNITAIFDALVAAGIQPIVMTVPPRSGTYGLIPEYNLRLSRLAAVRGYSVMDQYGVLTDPATGQPLASLTADNIHPNAAGCKAVAQKAVEDIAPRFPKPLDVTVLSPSSANIIPNGGLTVDSNADGIAEGSSATLSSGFTVSLVTDPAGFKWQRATIATATGDKTISGPNIVIPDTPQVTTTLAAAASAGATSLSLTANVGAGTYKLTNALGQYEYVRVLSTSGSGPYTATLWTVTPLKFNHSIGDTISPAITIGDKLALAVRVRSGQDGGVVTWQVTAYNASSGVISNRILTTPNTGLSRKLDDAMCYNEFVVPANTKTLQFSMKVTPIDGTYDYAMPLMYNLTKAA